MGNTIKNFEKKRRKERKEAQREINSIVHKAIMDRMNLPKDFKEKENEIFESYNQLN